MKILNVYTPGELIFILNKSNKSKDDLLKLTILDLLLKKVIKILLIKKNLKNEDVSEDYKYVTKGENFEKYRALPHEAIFLNQLHKSYATRILFRNFVRVANQKAYSLSHYTYMICQSPKLQDSFSKTFIQKLFGGFDFTLKGREMNKELNSEIKEMAFHLQNIVFKEKEKALEIVSLINGNVFLLDIIGFEYIQNIEADVFRESVIDNKVESKSESSDIVWLGYTDFSSNYEYDINGHDSNGNGCGGIDAGSSGCGGSGCGGGGCGGGCGS